MLNGRRKRALCVGACTAAFLLLFFISPLFPYVRSLAVMKIYSASCAKGSLPETNGFEVSIPSGRGWYPFVMNFSDDNGFSVYTDKPDMRLTIFYNFSAFDLTKGCSRLYDVKSPYYSAFYGAYFVENKGALSEGGGQAAPYGFAVAHEKDSFTGGDEQRTDAKNTAYLFESNAVAEVARFDYFNLVLGDFGLRKEDRVFSYEETARESGASFIGYEGWTRIECEMRVNGAAHVKEGSVQSYLQYGEPAFPADVPFAPVDMHGIIIARYFEEFDVSAFFYCMAPDRQVCLDCEEEILRQSSLRNIENRNR